MSRDRNQFGGRIKSLVYRAFDWNTHPIDIVEEGHGFGPFPGPWAPYEFEDPAGAIDITWGAGSNNWRYQPTEAQPLELFRDPSTDRVNQILATLAAQQHLDSGAPAGDLFGGIGQGRIMT